MLNAKPVKTKSTEPGIKYEAITLGGGHEKHMHKIGNLWRLKNVDFLCHPQFFFLGCSPDGKVVDSVCKDQFGLVPVQSLM